MIAVISSTYDDKYLWNLPLVTWAWNKIGVDVICFLPEPNNYERLIKFNHVLNTLISNGISYEHVFFHFKCPEDKEATYAQCSRLYAGCLDLPEDEILVTSDADMCVFKTPVYIDYFTIFGYDLVPEKQYPMCYISATVKQWRKGIDYKKSYQENLDDLLGSIECESFRGNYWGKDQETAFNLLENSGTKVLLQRAREGTQFASKRYDRDDAYLLDRLDPDTIDFHMLRPGYDEKNFDIILKIMKYHYPNEDFQWLVDYNNAYKKLL